MRKFSQVSPLFWTGKTGRELRKLGPECQLIALYLMTCPSGIHTGLFYIPIVTIAHETGSPFEGASKGLRRVCETGFSSYDIESETVFLPEMAFWQNGASLKAGDKRVKGIENALAPYRTNPFYLDFWERYGKAYSLNDSMKPDPSEGASKGLRRGFEGASPKKEREKEREIGIQEREYTSCSKARKTRSEITSKDLEFAYLSYPKKTGKAKGLAKAKAVIKTKAEYDQMMTCISAMSEAWEGKGKKFCPGFEAFVNGKRWQDADWPMPQDDDNGKHVGHYRHTGEETYSGGDVEL